MTTLEAISQQEEEEEVHSKESVIFLHLELQERPLRHVEWLHDQFDTVNYVEYFHWRAHHFVEREWSYSIDEYSIHFFDVHMWYVNHWIRHWSETYPILSSLLIVNQTYLNKHLFTSANQCISFSIECDNIHIS